MRHAVALDDAVPRCARHDVVLALLRSVAAGEHEEALKFATTAVETAVAHGMVQTVAAQGRAAVELVERCAWRAPASWLDRVRRASANALAIEHDSRSERSAGIEPLTDRERDVVRFLPSRLTLQEIANELYISMNTLKFHLKVIYRKLGVSSRAEAAEDRAAADLDPHELTNDQLMKGTEQCTAPSPIDDVVPTNAQLNVRQAAFIGVGAMVGAGIFSLLGAAGEVAGAAVWISFLLAGTVAMLQGYSFAKFGSRYPSAGGMLEYVRQGFGDGHITGVIAWLLLGANAIITGMVAVSFGSYASSAATDGDENWAKVFAVGVVVVMTGLNVVGSQAVARVQTLVVVVVIGILSIFAVSTLANLDPDLLAPSNYPSVARHHRQHRADVLRVLGIRRDHVHGEGSRQSQPSAPAGHVPGARDRHHDLRGGRPRRVRHPHRRRGDRVGWHRPRRRRRTDARSRRLLDDDRDRALRHVGSDQRRAVPGEGALRGDDRDTAVPTRDGFTRRRAGRLRPGRHGRRRIAPRRVLRPRARSPRSAA